MFFKKYLYAVIGFVSFFYSAYSQESKSDYLYVAFDITFDFTSSKSYNAVVSEHIPSFEKIQNEYKIQLFKAIPISEDKLNSLANNAIAVSGSDISVRKLNNIFKIVIENPTQQRLEALTKELKTLEGVEYVSLMSSTPIKPPNDISPTTPDFESNQTYLDADPGVNMRYAWNLGFNGTGMRIRDVEYGFNKNHEELVDRNVFIFPGMTISSSATAAYIDHGTAVTGILYADKGAYGVSGMAYGATELLFFPEWQQSGYDRLNAVTKAIENSLAGDVIVFEMQTLGNSSDPSDYVAAEYDYPIWSLTKAASDAGIIVVAAAGNGNEDLDSTPYDSYRNRGDSGAIIVGAGSADINHERIYYSTYGSRVDLQGWAENVRTSGYGDFVQIAGDSNQSYTNFGGTSSATPIVASCVAVLQSYYYSLTGSYLTAVQMRDILKQTGIPQGIGVAGNIGPLPNMQDAMIKIFNDLGIGDFDANQFVIYPNPVQDKMIVMINSQLTDPKIEIYSGIGQLLNTVMVDPGENTIDFSNYSNGFYFIKLVDNGRVFTKKIIKP